MNLYRAGPPSKKFKMLTNGIISEGTLDEPSIVMDDLSKDSVGSRVSDNSDGFSSKPVSNISSGAILSAAPSPLSITQDSNQSPPLSVVGGVIGAESSAALISQDDSKASFSTVETDINSVVGATATTNDQPQAPEVRPPAKRGRKKKKSTYMDRKNIIKSFE